MSKNKLSKFADKASYPHVFEAPGTPLSEPHPTRGHWHTDFFRNNNPIVLELGCGRGEYTVGLAHLFPEKNFIGVDIKGARMWSGATQALQEGLPNVAFVRTNIEFIERFFAPNEVAEIWLTFSDPQMKKATKRLTSTYFMQRYRKFLTDNGIVHLKTDSNFLQTYTHHMVQHNALPLLEETTDLYGEMAKAFDEDTQRILSIQTYYESQWRARGLAIRYMKFRLPQAGELQEPDVEIPLDEYRSYNRSKRSGLEYSK